MAQCPDRPGGRCVWGATGCDCHDYYPGLRDCSEMRTREDCTQTMCPDQPTRRCEWRMRAIGDGDGAGEMECGCPSVVRSCREHRTPSECHMAQCPDRPGGRCVWGSLVAGAGPGCNCYERPTPAPPVAE
eukprot:Sspe_Gene.55109::Locus_30347_Transcript_4_6_Confidence_0.417_Length_389::g.55109::m.55109